MSEYHDPQSKPSWLVMLEKLADEADALAKAEGLGEVTRETVQLKNNLVCVEINFRDGSDDVYPYYRLYANGRHRGDSLIKLENLDDTDDGSFVLSSNPKALLALISF